MPTLGDDMNMGEEGMPPVNGVQEAGFPRRRARGAPLQDELGDVGDRLVGSPKETVASMQKRKSMQQVYIVLTVLGVLGGVGGTYLLAARSSRKSDAPTVSTGKEARQAGGAEIIASSAPDSGGADVEIGEPAPIEVTAPQSSVPGVPAVPAAAPGNSGTGAGGTVAQMGVPGAGSPSAAMPAMPRGNTMELLPPPMPNDGHRTATGDVPALGEMGGGGLAPVPVVRGRAMTDRLEKLSGFGKASGGSENDAAARWAARRSPIAPGPVREAAASGSSALGADAGAVVGARNPSDACYAGRLVPGTRVVATAAIGSPAATSGEALEATLDEALTVNGVEVLPAGTTAYGIGRVFNDGTGHPRLVVDFTTYKRPDNSVCTLPGVTYAMTDRRVGLNVPLNHQWAAKTRRIGIASGIAAITAKLTGDRSAVQVGAGGLAGVPSAENEAKKTAYGDALNVVKQETNLNQPTSGTILTLPEGFRFWIVYGMPGAGGSR